MGGQREPEAAHRHRIPLLLWGPQVLGGPVGSERGVWGGSLTLRCQHLTQQKTQSPAKSRRPKIPPSTMAKSFGEALVNPGDKTARERERERSFSSLPSVRVPGILEGPRKASLPSYTWGLTLGRESRTGSTGLSQATRVEGERLGKGF